MNYKIEYEQLAIKQLKKLEKSGRNTDKERLSRFIEEIKINPRIGNGKPEQMKYYQGDVWSRKLNKKDRMVYEIIETEKIVFIIQVLGRYQDK